MWPCVPCLASPRQFYTENPKEHFDGLPFNQRMGIVDEFIKDKVTWKSDLSQYGVLGLLTSPTDVLKRGCQGQSSVTASLLFVVCKRFASRRRSTGGRTPRTCPPALLLQ